MTKNKRRRKTSSMSRTSFIQVQTSPLKIAGLRDARCEVVPLFPDTTRNLFSVLSYLALATALYVAIRVLFEKAPRRLLALLALSQPASILAGLEKGVTRALMHWIG